MSLCRKCGKREAVTSDGCCYPCKNKEANISKFHTFGRRQKALNRILSGGVVSD
jgi:hypothetical protein